MLQEVACDYRVRVSKSYWGNLRFDEIPLSLMKIDQEDYGCINMDSNNVIDLRYYKSKSAAQSDEKEFYFINFKVLGKYYLAYGSDVVSTWVNVIKKARAMNKRFFYGQLDRHKIK